MEDDVFWDEQHNKSNFDEEDDMYNGDMMIHEQMFSEESDDDEFCFKYILLILVHLIGRFDSRGVYWS